MKTSILNLSAVAILIGFSFFASRIQLNENNFFFNSDDHNQIEQTTADTYVITSAIEYEGEIIPVVYLPEFTVEAEMSTKYLVHAIVNNGEVMPYVMLPTLTIEG